jgi:hypothetical protein
MGGIYKKPAEMPAPPNWMFYVRVANLEASVEKVKANGGSITLEPHDVPGGGRIAMCMDPQGAAFALLGSSANAAGPAVP